MKYSAHVCVCFFNINACPVAHSEVPAGQCMVWDCPALSDTTTTLTSQYTNASGPVNHGVNRKGSLQVS